VQAGERGAVAPALAALEKALAGSPRRGEGLALLGRALTISGEYAHAERVLRDAVAAAPVDPEAFGYLANASEALAHFAGARDALMTLDALQGDTASTETRAARAARIGALSLRANDPGIAADYLSQAIAAGRNDPQLFALLAQARWHTGDKEGALEALRRGLRTAPANPELLRLNRELVR
jgi:predicted Zn-dependent protease